MTKFDQSLYDRLSPLVDDILDLFNANNTDTETAIAVLGAAMNCLLDEIPHGNRYRIAQEWTERLLEQVRWSIREDRPDA
jgi:uncharacterized protein YejL (UPF0352 family)